MLQARVLIAFLSREIQRERGEGGGRVEKGTRKEGREREIKGGGWGGGGGRGGGFQTMTITQPYYTNLEDFVKKEQISSTAQLIASIKCG